MSHNRPIHIPSSQTSLALPSGHPKTIKKQKTASVVSTRKDSSDSIEPKGKFKTQLCKYYLIRVECPFFDLCCFAHGEQELRSKQTLPQKYKTKHCLKFTAKGYCSYGPRCQFIHSRKSHIIKYAQMMEKIGQDSEVFYEYMTSQAKTKPRRLSFFESIDEEASQGLSYDQKQYNIASEVMLARTRHNSI